MVGALAVDPETTLPAIIDRTRDVDPEARQAAQALGRCSADVCRKEPTALCLTHERCAPCPAVTPGSGGRACTCLAICLEIAVWPSCASGAVLPWTCRLLWRHEVHAVM